MFLSEHICELRPNMDLAMVMYTFSFLFLCMTSNVSRYHNLKISVFEIPVVCSKGKIFVLCNTWSCMFEPYKCTKIYVTEKGEVH
jgi:hypothetical protein